MLKVMPADELKKTWEKVLGGRRRLPEAAGQPLEAKGKYEIVYVTCEFAKKKLDTRVVFDKDAKITGLSFRSTTKAAPTGAEEIYEGKLKVGATELRLVLFTSSSKKTEAMPEPWTVLTRAPRASCWMK